MIASNTWMAELDQLACDEDRKWLMANSILVQVTSPLYVEEQEDT